MTIILWFKRDLRTADHPALRVAAGLGPVLPLYVWEPDLWAQPDMSGRQFDFAAEAVADLRTHLDAIGLTLCERVGDVVDVLNGLQPSHLISHEETGNGWTFARDKRVATWARGQGVSWREIPQSGVVRRMARRDGWAAQRNVFVERDIVPPPGRIAGVVAPSDDIPRLAPQDHCPNRQRGGRSVALRHLDSFLHVRGQHYRREMSSPLGGERACSRLSPYLAFGCVSVREIAQATAERQRDIQGTRDGWGGSLRSYQARLAWRDHFTQKLEDEPQLEFHNLHSAYNGMRADDVARRTAWEDGATGLPFVDACMRYLRASGWMNFRMRSMLMAVASYHLWLDWRQTGLHLARQFTDYEPGIHWPQVQMQSGTTGMNTVRIYNPIKQGYDQDLKGAFTRKWVPELDAVPQALLQEPWRWDGARALSYPAPIIDVKAAAAYARVQIHGVRKGQAFRHEAAGVIDKHASRKDPQGRFVNDRARRKPKPDPRQGSFDL